MSGRDPAMVRSGTGGATSDGLIEALDEVLTIDLSGMRNTTFEVIQVTDDGEVELSLEYTINGTNWILFHAVYTEAETEFAAGNGAVIPVPFVDANGMPLAAKAARLRANDFDVAGGVYAFKACGMALDGQR